MALRSAAIAIPENRILEPARLPPTEFVQDLPGRPRHSGTESTGGTSSSRHKDHIGQADSDVPWNTRRACGPSWTARRRIKATLSQSVRKASVTRGSSCRTRPSAAGGKPTVAVLGTGGTIASYVDYRTGAVHPAVTAEELVFSVPELLDVCNVRARVIYSIFSENLKPENWQHLALEVAKELSSGAAGVIIPHGTDTLHFTTAALSFLLRDLTGPVVVVGAQRSSDRPSSDAASNLLSAARVSVANLGEVVAVMHGETSDTFGLIHRGTKVRKMHSSRRDAFRSLNATPLGRVHSDGTVELTDRALPRARGPTKVDDALDLKVALVSFYPGQPPTQLEAVLEGQHGVVIAGTGLGHVAHDLIPILHRATRDGIAVVMTTQTLQGRVSMRVYDTGRDLLKAGVIEGQDMTPETAYVKLMWVLGHTREHAEVARAMATNVAGEINPKIGLDEFAD